MNKLKKDQLNPNGRLKSDSSMSEYEVFKMNNLIQRQRRDSTSSVDEGNQSQFSDSNITLFNTLLTDPTKRAKVLELLTKEGLVPNENGPQRGKKGTGNSRGRGRGLFSNYMKTGKFGASPQGSPVQQVKKRHQIESPSALHRRRALQKLESENSDAAADSTDSSMSASQDQFHGTPKPFNQLLKGVIAYCEVRSSEGDRSEAIKMMMRAMGATVKDTIFRGITHVVFKDGSFRTYEKAKLVNAHLVSVLWLEATKRNRFRVPECKYPALGTAAYDYNVTTLCQSMQREYDNILKDEIKRRSTIHSSRRNSDFVSNRRTMHGSETMLERSKNDSLLGEMRRIHHGDASLSTISRRNSSPVSDNDDSFLSADCNIIPSSQNDSPFLRKPRMTFTQNKEIEPIMELTEDESLETSNIAKHIKNSFELKKSMNIRSPESLFKNKSLDISDKSSKQADEDSLRLHITTDESNITGNKSRRSSNTKSDLSNKISTENLTPKPKPKRNSRKTISDDLKSDSNLITNYFASQNSPMDPPPLTKAKQKKILRRSIENELKAIILSDSDSEDEIAKRKAIKPKLRKSRMTIASYGTNESEPEQKKEDSGSKIRKRRSLYNPNPKKDTGTKENEIPARKSVEGLEIIEDELEKKKQDDKAVPKVRKRRTLYKVNPENDIEDTENEIVTRKSIEGVEINEDELEKKKQDDTAVPKVRKRRTLFKVNPENDIEDTDNEIVARKSIEDPEINEDELKTKKKDDTAVPKVRKRRTLYKVNPEIEVDNTENEIVARKSIEGFVTNEDGLEKKKQDDTAVPKVRKRRTLYKVNPENDVENETVAKKPIEKIETSPIQLEKMPKNNVPIEKIRKRRTLFNTKSTTDIENFENESIVQRKSLSSMDLTRCNDFSSPKENLAKENHSTKDDLTKNNILKENTNDANVIPKKTRTRKLFNVNQSLSQINWDIPGANLENEVNIAVKKGKFLVDIPPEMKAPKIFTRKARNYVKKSTTTSSEDKSVKKKKTDRQNTNITSTENETESSGKKIVNTGPIKKIPNPNFETETESGSPEKRTKKIDAPRRKSMRIASKVLDSDIESIKSPPKTSTDVDTPEKKPRKNKIRTQKNTQSTIPGQNFKSRILEEIADRRSTFEFVQRDHKKSPEIKLTQKPPSKLTGIVCTRMHRPDVLLFEQIVKKIGGFIVEDEVTEKTTHLVAGQPNRTINMLRAIARGCWILRKEWLFKSLEAGKWLEEEEYECTEFSAAVQKCRMERQTFGPLYSMDIFKDCGNIYVSRASTPRCSDLEELVLLCGGNIVKNPRQAQIIVGEYFRYDSVICVNEKWVLECISCNKKKSFKNFAIERKSTGSSTC